MRNRDTFSGYHPLINFLYFALVLVFSVFFTHPVSQIISLAAAMTYSVRLNGRQAMGRTAFSIYRFDSRDRMALLWLGFCGFFIVSGWIAGGFYWRYYPTVKSAAVTPLTVLMQLCYLAQTPGEKRKLSRRTTVAVALILLLIPLTMFIGEVYLESRKPQARELVIIAILLKISW